MIGQKLNWNGGARPRLQHNRIYYPAPQGHPSSIRHWLATGSLVPEAHNCPSHNTHTASTVTAITHTSPRPFYDTAHISAHFISFVDRTIHLPLNHTYTPHLRRHSPWPCCHHKSTAILSFINWCSLTFQYVKLTYLVGPHQWPLKLLLYSRHWQR